MVQGGKRLGFALKSREAIGVLWSRGRQNFDRNITIELRIAGAIDLAHSAGPEQGLDLVRTDS